MKFPAESPENLHWTAGCLAHMPPHMMANHAYQIIVRPYMCGQYRLQLCGAEDANPVIGPGILREACTYQPDTAARVLAALLVSPEPESMLDALATDYNCEGPGGRIRLDNRQEDMSATK